MRCNAVVDCVDFSDEMNCKTIQLIDNYRKEFPPIAHNHERLRVLVNLMVMAIDNIGESGKTFSVKALIQLKWRDSRLFFNNLNNLTEFGDNIGSEERNQLWLPKLIIINSLQDFQLPLDEMAFLSVQREGLPMLNSDDEVQENLIYIGDENSLWYQKVLSLELQCFYNFSNYPFDQQICPIEVHFYNICCIFYPNLVR